MEWNCLPLWFCLFVWFPVSFLSLLMIAYGGTESDEVEGKVGGNDKERSDGNDEGS